MRGLRVEDVPADWRLVRWEILNSYAIEDLERALLLYNRADDLKLHDLSRLRIMRGHVRYWGVFASEADISFKDLFWEPTIYPDGTGTGVQSLLLFASGFGTAKNPKSQLSEEELSALRYSTVDLESGFRLRPEAYWAYRPILARCRMLTGQPDAAATEYENVLVEFEKRLELEALKVAPGFSKYVRQSVAENLVTLGRTERAIGLLEELAESLPAEKGLYLRVAELQHKENRFDDVGISLTKERERDPEIGENWLISHVLMRSTSPLTPEMLSREIKGNPKIYAPLEFALREHWAPFARLCDDSRERWLVGTQRLATISPEPRFRSAQLRHGVQPLVESVERELHDRLFVTFKRRVLADSEQRAAVKNESVQDPEHAEVFCDFLLKRDDRFTLGQMIYTLDPKQSKGPVFERFREWVRQTFPELRLLPDDLRKLNKFRQPTAHGGGLKDDSGLEYLFELCRDTLAAIVNATPR